MEKRAFTSKDGVPLEIRLLPADNGLKANVFDGDVAVSSNDYSVDDGFLVYYTVNDFFNLIEKEWTV